MRVHAGVLIVLLGSIELSVRLRVRRRKEKAGEKGRRRLSSCFSLALPLAAQADC
jgi:hypothetical protein